MPDVEVLRRLRGDSVPALLEGPPGTGKTSLIEAAFGDDLITVAGDGDGDTTAADLVGEYTQNPDGTFTFIYGPLVRAMQEGKVLFLDDATLISPPAPAGCSLTLDRYGPRGEHAAYRGTGPTMQRAWDEVRAQLGHDQPQPAASGTREAPGPARGSDRLYRVVQYHDSWPFHNDSRVPRGSQSRRRTDTFRTLGPVKDRLARANGHTRYQRRNGGDWSAFVAIAEQLTDDGWQPIDVDLLQENPVGTHRRRRPRRHRALNA